MLASAIISKIRNLADIVGSQFITDTELLGYLSISYSKLYSELVTSGQGYYLSTANIDLVTGIKSYGLPTDIYKLLGVDYDNGSSIISLRPFNFKERNKYSSAGNPVAYNLAGNNLILTPTPSVTKTAGVVLYYAPTFTEITATTDMIALPVDGMEAYLIWESVANCQAKEEGDSTFARQKLIDAYNDFKRALSPRDEGECSKVIDVMNSELDFPITPYF